jgi:nucleoside-diphosphate-sugar epimerase
MTGTIGRHLSSHVIELKCDLTSLPKDISEVRKSTLVHLASRVGSMEVDRDPKAAHQINVEGTLQLAKLAIKSNCDRFIFISTSHVYKPHHLRIKETDVIEPLNRYAEQKYQAEIMLQEMFSQQTKSNLIILRIFSVIGKDSKPFTLGGAVKRILAEEQKVYIPNASDVRDFMTPQTVAHAIETVARNNRVNEKILNICSGVGTTVRDAALNLAFQHEGELREEHFIEGNSAVPVMIGDPFLLNRHIRIKPLLD